MPAERQHVAPVARDKGIGLSCLGQRQQVVVVRIGRDIDLRQRVEHDGQAAYVVDHAPGLDRAQPQAEVIAAAHAADFLELLLAGHQDKAAVAPRLV